MVSCFINGPYMLNVQSITFWLDINFEKMGCELYTLVGMYNTKLRSMSCTCVPGVYVPCMYYLIPVSMTTYICTDIVSIECLRIGRELYS